MHVNEDVYIWRDNQWWIRPEQVTKLNWNDIEVSHIGSTKSAIMNGVRNLEVTITTMPHPGPDESQGALTPLETSMKGPLPDMYSAFPLDDNEDEFLDLEEATHGDNFLHPATDVYIAGTYNSIHNAHTTESSTLEQG